MEINYVRGDIIHLAKEGNYEVIAHGNNCFCNQDRGVAKHFANAFRTNDPSVYKLEDQRFKGDINKLGQIESRKHVWDIDQLGSKPSKSVYVVNAYTQYRYGNQEVHVDYDAIRLCFRKINHRFKGKHIGLPMIGAGLAKGDWVVIERIIQQEFKDCAVTIVEYERKRNTTRSDA